MKTKHILMACILTGIVTPPSAQAGLNLSQLKQLKAWVAQNPNTASAIAGIVAGTAGGSAITHAIMKPAEGSTVTVRRQY